MPNVYIEKYAESFGGHGSPGNLKMGSYGPYTKEVAENLLQKAGCKADPHQQNRFNLDFVYFYVIPLVEFDPSNP